MSQDKIERVPAFRLESFQSEDTENDGIQCQLKCVTQVPLDQVHQHFAAMYTTLLEGAKELGEKLGFPVLDMMLATAMTGKNKHLSSKIKFINHDGDHEIEEKNGDSTAPGQASP